MSVSAKIAQHLRGTAESGLGIHNPIFPVHASQQLGELV
jgi:hypothetical protein